MELCALKGACTVLKGGKAERPYLSNLVGACNDRSTRHGICALRHDSLAYLDGNRDNLLEQLQHTTLR